MRGIVLLTFALLLVGCEEKGPAPIPIDRPLVSDPALKGEEVLQKVTDLPIWSYRNVNGNLPNIILIDGKEGLIIIDTGLSLNDSKKVVDDIKSKFDKPVKALIYTHHHIDHTGGAASFLEIADPNMAIIGSEHLNEEMQDENNVVGRIMGMRAYYMYGMSLYDEEETKAYRIGLSGKVQSGKTGFLPTTRVITKESKVELAGENFILFPTGGEAGSHIAVYMEDHGVIFSGDEMQGPSFPNLHSLRGTKPRDANKWITALDRIRAFEPKIMVPSHGNIVEGADEIETVIRTYRDAIQWTHDQAIRLINKGYTQEELAEALPALPESLQLYPYTKEFYGTVKHSVRNYFTGYISWFDGDPATLNPTPRVERSRRYVKMMGGREAILAAALAAKDTNDPQWVAELTTHLIRIDHDDIDARRLKAWSFRVMARQTINTNWQGFYLTGALELENKVDSIAFQKHLQSMFSPKFIDSIRLLNLLRYNVDGEKAEGKDIKIQFRFPDRNETFTLHLRNQILDIRSGEDSSATASLIMNRSLFDQILSGEKEFLGEMISGDIDLEGSRLDALSLLSSLDTEPTEINLVIR
ncbi:alkyl sulfatase dimerization domain-containing protein [Temperatibacter marinus]|uniref:Alkyl sulfatase dimerization domain-containing protein n=1 Tax=Temperatibacter marinus TaxID=1456591 RepID=A0AA52EEQ4_9PROT|nr:alkyl sulfatase dimerization domain-containing protein [Temperatibacter marinus]WND01450.1 alkyl sulfatase dimerization domain-containing protein [Temperatibacter marinus]